VALSVKKGTITTARTTAGTQAYTGVGFQPKALIFFATGMSSAGIVLQAPSAIGFAVSSTQRAAIASYSDYDTGGESNATTTQLTAANNGKDTRNNAALVLLWGGDPVINAVADLVSMDADGFTLNWTDPANVTTRVIHYVALGGADLTNAAVTTHAVVRTTAGTEAYTGIGFQPDCVLLMSGSPQATAGTSAVDDTVCFGWACLNPSAAIEQACFTWFDNDAAANMQTFLGNRSDSCFIAPTAVDAIDCIAAMSSFDSNGFTLNWTDPVAATTGRTFYALSLKGGGYKSGAEAKSTSSIAQNITGQPFQPKGVFFAMTGLTSDNTSSAATTECFFSLGASDGSTDGSITNIQQDANAVSFAKSNYSITRALQALTGSTTTVNAGDYDVTALNSDGFSGTWANANASAYRWYWLMMGDTPTVAPEMTQRLLTAPTLSGDRT
jgi:hypothetical protein